MNFLKLSFALMLVNESSALKTKLSQQLKLSNKAAASSTEIEGLSQKILANIKNRGKHQNKH